jgi:hypothetical protein
VVHIIQCQAVEVSYKPNLETCYNEFPVAHRNDALKPNKSSIFALICFRAPLLTSEQTEIDSRNSRVIFKKIPAEITQKGSVWINLKKTRNSVWL